MGNPRHRKRNPALRLDLAKQALKLHGDGMSQYDIGRVLGVRSRRVPALLQLARRQPDAPAPKPAPAKPRTPRLWRTAARLKLTGTIGGDAMAQARIENDRTLDEPTHELQRIMGDEWECISVGDAATMSQRGARQAQIDGEPADVYRVVQRVPRDG